MDKLEKAWVSHEGKEKKKSNTKTVGIIAALAVAAWLVLSSLGSALSPHPPALSGIGSYIVTNDSTRAPARITLEVPARVNSIWLWDWDAEDGDVVEVGGAIMHLTHQPVEVPVGGNVVQIKCLSAGTHPPCTVAVGARGPWGEIVKPMGLSQGQTGEVTISVVTP